MIETVSHDLQERTPEAKARWFQSLSLEERMELLCVFTDLVYETKALIAEQNNDPSVAERIRVLSNDEA